MLLVLRRIHCCTIWCRISKLLLFWGNLLTLKMSWWTPGAASCMSQIRILDKLECKVTFISVCLTWTRLFKPPLMTLETDNRWIWPSEEFLKFNILLLLHLHLEAKLVNNCFKTSQVQPSSVSTTALSSKKQNKKIISRQLLATKAIKTTSPSIPRIRQVLVNSWTIRP